MKKWLLVLCFIIILTGCNKIVPRLDVNKRIYNTFANLQSYEADIKVTTYSNSNSNTFETKQYYRYPEQMRSETDGIITIINNGHATVKNFAADTPLKIEQISSDENDFLFLHCFFNAYYKNEDTIAVPNSDRSDIITLTAETGLSNPYRKTVELKLNTDTMQPVSLETKGKDGKTYIKIEYISFKPNITLSDDLF